MEDPSLRFDILPGLPPYGPLPELFSETGSDTNREGFVVKFFPDASEAWVGNFQPGITSFSGAFPHPDKRHVVVVAGGTAHVVDPEARRCVGILAVSVESCLTLSCGLLFSDHVRLGLVGATRSWHTRRLAWDGIRIVQVADDFVAGEAGHFDGAWHSFRVMLADGQAFGGSYDGPET